jgi:predicted transposase YbfD/YdcC
MIADYFGDITDKRKARGKRHKLIDIIAIAMCGVICGADDWVAIAQYGEAKENWLRSFLELPHGIPSHDTFGDVFAWIDPEEFRKSFLNWVQAVVERVGEQVISIDGKTLRGSQDRRHGKEAIEMVSAWAHANQIVLGQMKVPADSHEIKAIPQLLHLLDIEGCLVTMDAAGCQKEIIETVLSQGGEYLVALKKNQGLLYQDTKYLFDDLAAQGDDPRVCPHDYAKTTNKGHGRIEIRECWVIDGSGVVEHFRTGSQWQQLRSLIKVKAKRIIDGKQTIKERYFISSLSEKAAKLLAMLRTHWNIENGLHWVLDVAFLEDHNRVRTGHAPENLAILRHIAVNLLKQEQTKKIGIKNKRLRCAWDHEYLLQVLLS